MTYLRWDLFVLPPLPLAELRVVVVPPHMLDGALQQEAGALHIEAHSYLDNTVPHEAEEEEVDRT